MESAAQTLKQLKLDHTQFKKDNEDVFDENRAFNKKIKVAGLVLIETMKVEGKEKFDFDGTEFEVKVDRTAKHDLDKITELVTDEGALKEYLDEVSSEKSKVMTRKVKKKRKAEEVEVAAE